VDILSPQASAALIGAAIGFTGAIFAEPLRRWLFRPRIALIFGSEAEYRARTPVQVEETSEPDGRPRFGWVQADYIRVRVRNTTRRLATKCRAYLVNVERMGPGGKFVPTIYQDTVPLPWSCRDPNPYEPIDIPGKMSVFLDLASARETFAALQLHTSVVPYRYSRLTLEAATYRFTVQVAGEEMDPAEIRICVKWGGGWDKMQTWTDSSKS
jgi:hypothetical protein